MTCGCDKKLQSGGRKKKMTCQQRIMKREMHAWKNGKLRSGSGQKGVKPKVSYRQAVAIGLSVAEKKCRRTKTGKKRVTKSRKRSKVSKSKRRK